MHSAQRHSFHTNPFHQRTNLPNQKPTHSPCSTFDSQSPRQHYNIEHKIFHDTKQKSQLCKKFIEQGFCPYKQKCKFAHGLHELRKNSQHNTKYKTKECGVFATEGCCVFGERCNFIHKKEFVREEKMFEVDLGFLELKGWKTQESRLLKMLQQ